MPRKFYKRRNKFTRRAKRRPMIARPVAMRTKTFKTPKGPWRKFNSVDPFPIQYNTKFVYCSDQTLNSNLVQRVTGVLYEWRLNSPFDPDYTSVAPIASNTTAYAYGELLTATGPYTRYKVNGVKIDITWYDPEIDGMAVVSHIKSNADGFAIAAQDIQYLERAPMTVVSRMNDSGSQKKHYTQYFPLSQLCGLNKLQYNADDNQATAAYNANPVFEPRLQLCVANNADNAQHYVRVRVKLTYYTTCYGRYSQSTKEAPV